MSFDAAIIGLGTMGAATAAELARRGLRVLGIEQFGAPHDLGSYGGSTRAIRLAYYEHESYVPLLRRAYVLWRELESESGQSLLRITGGLYMGRRAGGLVSGSLDSANRHRLPHRMLDAAELRTEYPQFSLPDDHVGFLEEDAGYLFCERAVTASVERALARGAELRFFEPIRAWSKDGSGIRITTDRSTYHAEHLLVCAGAWSAKLVRDLGVPLVATRQPLAWFRPRNPDPFREGTLPFWAIEQEADASLLYGFPLTDSPPGAKVAWHGRGPGTDPDTIDRSPQPADEIELRTRLAPQVPDLISGPLISMKICMYTYSPDCHFIVDRHPAYPNVHVACGFSGHGFKFAPVIGEILADQVTRGRTDLPANLFKLARFGI